MKNKIIWTLLLVFFLASFFYFAFFGNYLTGNAVISSPLSIESWSIETSGIILKMKNSEENAEIQKVKIEGCGSYTTPTKISKNSKLTIIIPCVLREGEEFRGEIEITYKNYNNDEILTSRGIISGRVL